MDSLEDRFLGAIELHSVEDLEQVIAAGLAVDQPIRDKPMTRWLTEMYTRSERFPQLARSLISRGAKLDDDAVAEVLQDDGPALAARLNADPSLLHRRTTMACAFTPLDGATLLHVAAEFQCARAARVLIERGADVNARAAVDGHGLGGHTAIFHTVNSNQNRALPMLELLLSAGADVSVAIDGLTWGRGFEWETTFFDLTPLAYAQLGPLPQMHRDEAGVYEVMRKLLVASNRPIPPLSNVPNAYLRSR